MKIRHLIILILIIAIGVSCAIFNVVRVQDSRDPSVKIEQNVSDEGDLSI